MYWYFVVRFLAATGARVSELVQTKCEHVRIGYLDLYSKGGKLRRIYIPVSYTHLDFLIQSKKPANKLLKSCALILSITTTPPLKPS